MLDKQFILSYTGQHVFDRGLEVLKTAEFTDYHVDENQEDGLIEVHADITDETGRHHAVVQLDITGTWIFDGMCDCSYHTKTMKPCRHIAAVLLYYVQHLDVPAVKNEKETKATDTAMKSLLNSFTSGTDMVMKAPDAPVIIEPHIFYRPDQNDMQVYFRIGMMGDQMYVIQNISDFCSKLKNHEVKRYGKSLEFVHKKEYFARSCHPLIRFLTSLAGQDDHFREESPLFYAYNNPYDQTVIKRNLSLQGRYLDAFIQVIQKIPFYVKTDAYMDEQFTIRDSFPELHAALEPADDGFLLHTEMLPFFIGNDYLYFINIPQRCINRSDGKDMTLRTVLRDFSRSEFRRQFIASSDLPVFSRYIYPVLSGKFILSADTFDPELYAAGKPEFEVYLDLPSMHTITCEITAVYNGSRYNIFDEIIDHRSRSEEDEKEFLMYVSGWFDSTDKVQKKMYLNANDESLYRLIRTGIPALQEKAAVFITDQLKKVRVLQAPSFKVGISYSNNLLQLNLSADQFTRQQLEEILGRYERKKKFYRLKDGSFIDIDESLNQLAELKEELSLTSEDLLEGTSELPAYRAMYLNTLSEEYSDLFERDQNFESLIWNMKESSEKHYPVPSGLSTKLRPYQVRGYEWLSLLKDNHFAGLLADEMGLGKTIQVIAFIGGWKDHGRILIVCPASLVYNWFNEIQRFMPSIKARMITGNANVRKELIQESDAHDIMITSYDLLKRDLEYYQDLQFSCEVIDEAQYIKNAGTQAAQAVKHIRSDFRIALTGTPIENHLSELWSVFDYLMPGYLYTYRQFRDAFEIPIVRDRDQDSEIHLQKLIAPFVLRRLKKEVLQDLPDKLEEVYYAPLTGEQKELYNARVQNMKLALENQSDSEFRQNKIAVLAELTRLRQICCDPSLLYSNYTAESAKCDLCIDMIRNAADAGHKILLFSQFTSMLDILTARLKKEGIMFHLLTGETPQKVRAEIVDSFQKDDVPVFCISLKAGGTGLNLTAADIVIHYDPWWNTAVENQASDRAHRIGQKNVVTIYRLIMKDTIEEKILEMQNEKADLADRILSGETISSSKLTREDLLNLLI